MSQLYENLTFHPKEKDLKTEFQCITKKVGNNLEQCLNVMYSARTYYNGLNAKNNGNAEDLEKWIRIYNKLIKKIENHIFSSINIKFKESNEIEVLEYYKTFYQKLALRSKDNSRIRIFTTNNDLYSETALDTLNIHYINGFSGGLRKYFNPAIFNYTWSKRMDTSIDKYEPVENIVYLYKIHGSVNWRETDVLTNNYFEIEEVVPSEIKSDGSVLIYPTPTKQDKSLQNTNKIFYYPTFPISEIHYHLSKLRLLERLGVQIVYHKLTQDIETGIIDYPSIYNIQINNLKNNL